MGSFLKWTRKELQQMGQKTRNLMTMKLGLRLRDDFDRLYALRKEGGSGIISTEYSIDTSITLLMDYVKQSREEILITTTRNNTNTRIKQNSNN